MAVADRAIARIAEAQHGLVTVAQLTELGADRTLAYRRVSAAGWERVTPGVFRLAGVPRTFEHRLLAAILAGPPGTAASHRSALRLWQLDQGRSAPIEITVPRGSRRPRPGVVIHTSRDLHLAECTTVSGIPVTGMARTILDLGAVEPHRVRSTVWAARRSGVVSWEDLLAVLVAHGTRGRSGVGPLRSVVAEHYRDVEHDSRTELLARRILGDAGILPEPLSQVRVTCADGVEVTVDLGWPQFRSFVEIFGVDHLTNEDLQHLDLHRRNQIELAGNRLLIYSGRMLRRRPDRFVADVVAMLRASGWPG